MSVTPKTLFVVENGLNTCYIDSLLMALFYKKCAFIDCMLINDPKNPEYIYLQEIIKLKFVDQVRRNISITADIVNEIRIYANICGWLQNRDNNEIFEQQDVNEFYTFLLNISNVPLIEIQRQTISEAPGSDNDIGNIEKIPFISLTVPHDCSQTSIKELLSSWMNNNTVESVRREVIDDTGNTKVESVKALNIYKIINVPTFMGLSFNRFNNMGKRSLCTIDIQKKIKLHHISDDNEGLRWTIHALICHTGETPKGGHYYAVLLSNNNSWLVFDDQAVPCLNEVNIKNNELSDTIKRQVVFAIYCYDEII